MGSVLQPTMVVPTSQVKILITGDENVDKKDIFCVTESRQLHYQSDFFFRGRSASLPELSR